MTQQLKDLIAKLVPDMAWRNVLESHIAIEIAQANRDGFAECLESLKSKQNDTH